MHGLILAGGEGSRLAASGITTPKALVPVAGVPQLLRLVRTFERLGCESVTCLLREGISDAPLQALRRPGRVPPSVYYCSTPSSLHTLVEGLGHVPPGPVFASMVDTIMPWSDWDRTHRAISAALASGADAVLVVTPYVADERPLYVRRDPTGRVVELGDVPVTPPCVTGGVYGLGTRARSLAIEALDQGLERMRAFLGLLVRRGTLVVAVEVPRIIDLDDRTDLEAANRWQEFCAGDGSTPV